MALPLVRCLTIHKNPYQAGRESSAVSDRFFANLNNPAVGQTVVLDAAESHHLVRVMRSRPGDQAFVFGQGREFSAVLREASPSGAVLELVTELLPPPPPSVCFTAAIPFLKGGNTDFLVEKLCELGAARIIVFRSRREVAHGSSARVTKLNRVALEACKQCGRADVPVVLGADSVTDAVGEGAASVGRSLILFEGDVTLTLSGAIRIAGNEISSLPWTLITGPEGGFDEEELNSLRGAATLVTLGPRILRAETAPLVAASALLTLAGDF
ncbi:hypothetical protein CVU37_03420 [candidate division BRC1 bacterium HGW-BRC1-1]|jgi:16S rRNA (uracil1498-N3)-methyltransferase|nr:MAG: hypothetical protein CVU37_03420 [candidate division BRC1 bacterium HGW-BRC1-1]